MWADEKLAFVFIESKYLAMRLVDCRVSSSIDVLVLGQVLLDVTVDGQSAWVDQLIEAKRVFRVIDLVLQHRVEVFEIDVGILDKRLGWLTHKHYLHAMIYLVQEDVNDFKDELRLDWHEDFCIEVRV